MPPNVEFLADDIEEVWFESSVYDFVHLRDVIGSIATGHDLSVRFTTTSNQEAGLNFKKSSTGPIRKTEFPVVHLMDGLRRAGRKCGRDMNSASSFRRWIESVNIKPLIHVKR